MKTRENTECAGWGAIRAKQLLAALEKKGSKYTVAEFHGVGDMFFGGTADDRPLGRCGQFLAGSYNISEIAIFDSEEEARKAANTAKQRAGSIISIVPERE